MDMYVAEKRTLSCNYNPYMANKGATSVSTSAWEAEDSGSVTLSGAANSSGVTSVLALAGSASCTIVKNTATLNTGEILVRRFKLNISDPAGEPDDYVD